MDPERWENSRTWEPILVSFRHFRPIRPLKPYSAEKKTWVYFSFFLFFFFSFFPSLSFICFWGYWRFYGLFFPLFFLFKNIFRRRLVPWLRSLPLRTFLCLNRSKLASLLLSFTNKMFEYWGSGIFWFWHIYPVLFSSKFLFIFIHCIDHHHLFNKSHLATMWG